MGPISDGRDPNRASSYRKVPAWGFHGAKDDIVKPEQSRRMVEALKFHEWIFEQRR